MPVKIVTDSTSDIISDLAQKLGITVVPLTVSFGHESFLDRVEISTDEFYRRLSQENIFPTTTQPAPGAFADVYNKLVEETDEILVIVISSKLSGTYQSATNAKGMIDLSPAGAGATLKASPLENQVRRPELVGF